MPVRSRLVSFIQKWRHTGILLENMYIFYFTYSVKMKKKIYYQCWVLGTFWKSQKLIPSKKNQSVLIAKITKSRQSAKINSIKNFVPHSVILSLLVCIQRDTQWLAGKSRQWFSYKKKPWRLAFYWQVVNNKYWSNFHFKYSSWHYFSDMSEKRTRSDCFSLFLLMF